MTERVVSRSEVADPRSASFVLANAVLATLVFGCRCVHVVDAAGELLGKIVLPGSAHNLCFGGRHHSRLLPCCRGTLDALGVNRRGVRPP